MSTNESGSDDPQVDRPSSLPDTTPPSSSSAVPADLIVSPVDSPGPMSESEPIGDRIKTFLIGRPRDLHDTAVFSHVTLIAFLAWVGLGADGLSSSCYGPAEAFIQLGAHSYLAVFLSLATIFTVLVISACYSHIIEAFPSGGGGYLVASKLLGPRVGVVSGCALLVDYVLTITVSVAAAGDALFSLAGPQAVVWKEPTEIAIVLLLIVLNLRGVKESVIFLMPIFLLFLATHAVLIVGALGMHVGEAGAKAGEIAGSIHREATNPEFGVWAMLLLFLRAYSMGSGTYTGIEAVSNSMPVMREPRVATAKRTMIYMAASLALTAGGLVMAYLLLDIRPPAEGATETMNHTLTAKFIEQLGFEGTVLGSGFLWTTLLSEGALLFVAAQAGFIDGPRVLANMAHDSWVPHWFAHLSERLATHNGVLLMGTAALAALLATGGNVAALVIMYSINVFVTFSLSMIGMCRYWRAQPHHHPLRRRRLGLFVSGATLCVAILAVTIYEKFDEGGWRTVAVTGAGVVLCLGINRHYRGVVRRLKRLDDSLGQLTGHGTPVVAEPDPDKPVAAILVGGYSGLGVHTLLNAMRFAPGHFEGLVFLSVGVIDSGNFKGAGAVDDLQHSCEESLGRYVDLANRLGLPSTSFLSIGTDAVDELEQLCLTISKRFPKAIFFAGQLVFQRDTWVQRLLHNQTAFSLQRRLQWSGLPMVILPTRVRS